MNNLKNYIKLGLEKINIQCTLNQFSSPQAMQKKLVTKEKPVIFDVGAHLGETYEIYRKHFPTAKIHLIEPFPASAEHLFLRTVEDPFCYLHEVALSNQEGEKKLHINAASATNSLSPLIPNASKTWDSSNLTELDTTTVTVRTLDNLCNEIDVNYIDILKIDVQGAELNVLRGALQLLDKQSIELIQIEYILADTYEFQQPLHEYLALLNTHQYDLVDFYQPLRRDGYLLQFDLLFRRTSREYGPDQRLA